MSTKLMILRAELTLEAVYERAEFGVYLQGGLLSRLFERLQPHGLRLADLKVERGTGTMAEFHVLGHLFEYLMAIRVRVDKVEFFCSQVTSENLKRFSAAVVDALSAVQGAFNVKYRVYALGIALHGTLAGQSAKDYLSQFVSQIPEIGTVAGNAVAYYYGQTEDRIASTVTLDVSTSSPMACSSDLKLRGTVRRFRSTICRPARRHSCGSPWTRLGSRSRRPSCERRSRVSFGAERDVPGRARASTSRT
jgi:hypothetical protein